MARAGLALTLLVALTAAAAARPKAAKPPHPATACPPAAALVARLTQAWKPVRGQKVVLPLCAAGRFGAPGWAAAAWLSGPGPARVLRHAIFDSAGKQLAVLDSGPLPPETAAATQIVRLDAADLEDDGSAELIEEVDVKDAGYLTQRVNVYHLASGKLSQIFSKQLGYDNSAAVIVDQVVVCSGSYTVAGLPGQKLELVFTGKIDHKPGAQPGDWAHCVSGSQTYVMKDGKLSLRR